MDQVDRAAEAPDPWVQAKFASLQPPAEWQPNEDLGLALLRRGQRSERIRKHRIFTVAALAAGGVALMAFPSTRVAAERCVDACVSGTSAITQLLGLKPSQSLPVGERKAAPAFRLSDADGNTVTLEGLRGRVVILNFWATWCAPCKVEIPWFVEFQRRFAGQGVTVVGISMDEDGWRSVRPYLAEHSVNYAVALGTEAMTREYGGVEALPTTVVIDRAGRIAVVHTGLVTQATYENDINRLLAEKENHP